jgi:hypothetical protein
MQPIHRSEIIALNAAADEVFPLFTPVGERLWVPGWNPEYVYPADGEAQTGNVFKTKLGDDETFWLTVKYDAQTREATYVNVTPNVRVTRIDIKCRPQAETCTAEVTYTVTPLSESAQGTFEEEFSEPNYKKWMGDWQRAINHYLEHGQMVPH